MKAGIQKKQFPVSCLLYSDFSGVFRDFRNFQLPLIFPG